ncbi:brix domain-containing protein [Cystoisospora suis]|uniref:Ribosome production factor 2 homolog n=1 Tax=Cystoisospora suis TaxID=483139 RepID=A0A2C6LAS5_9APIC|nr:brix domain-containing protein [Cystoisospora suis]
MGASSGLNLTIGRVAKTRKGKRVLNSRGPQLLEPTKKLLLMKGNKASMTVQQILSDIRDLKKPDAVYLHSRNQKDFHPFEDIQTGQYLCEKNNCGVFCLGSSSKKRPSRLVLGRMFANELLDMYELQVVHYLGSSSFSGVEKPRFGSKPLVLLQGAAFESTAVMKGLRNLMADIFRGGTDCAPGGSAKLHLKGIDRILAITALECDAAQAHLSKKLHLQAGGSTLTTEGAAATAVAATLPPAEHPEGEASLETDVAGIGGSGVTGHIICLRQYRVTMQKGEAGSKAPRVELVEVGPQIDMRLDRHRLADPDRWKRATRTSDVSKKKAEAAAPGREKGKKRKNVTTTVTSDVIGRVYVDKPDWKALDKQNVLLMKQNRKRAKLASEGETRGTASAESHSDS